MSKRIKIFDKTFEVYIPKEEIDQILNRLAASLNADYQDEEVVMISILDGAFIFMSDLIRRLYFPLHIEFVKLKSYEGIASSGVVEEMLSLKADISGKHVIVVEDIVDTGLTIDYFLDALKKRKPKSLKVCALLSKPEVHNDIINIDYLGKEIPPAFVIGYGLDIDGLARQFPDIYQLVTEDEEEEK